MLWSPALLPSPQAYLISPSLLCLQIGFSRTICLNHLCPLFLSPLRPSFDFMSLLSWHVAVSWQVSVFLTICTTEDSPRCLLTSSLSLLHPSPLYHFLTPSSPLCHRTIPCSFLSGSSSFLHLFGGRNPSKRCQNATWSNLICLSASVTPLLWSRPCSSKL